MTMGEAGCPDRQVKRRSGLKEKSKVIGGGGMKGSRTYWYFLRRGEGGGLPWGASTVVKEEGGGPLSESIVHNIKGPKIREDTRGVAG